MNNQKIEKEFALESVVSSAVQLPGVKVDRQKFLSEMFSSEDVIIQDILEYGPIAANISQDRLKKLSTKLILKRTTLYS